MSQIANNQAKFDRRVRLRVEAANPDDVFAARRFFGDDTADWLLAAVQKGKLKASVIRDSEKEKYLIVWHKDAQDRLHINCAIERNGGNDWPLLMAGLKELARTNGCNAMACNTPRDGLVKKLLEYGWNPVGTALKYEF